MLFQPFLSFPRESSRFHNRLLFFDIFQFIARLSGSSLHVFNEAVSRTITNHLALPVLYALAPEIQMPSHSMVQYKKVIRH